MPVSDLRNDRYLEEAVATASPARLLTLLYDRLVRDLTQAERLFRAGDQPGGRAQVDHACEILTQLLSDLDGARWDGAPGLARLYAWFISQLVGAGIRGDAEGVATLLPQVTRLRDAWHGAASGETSTA